LPASALVADIIYTPLETPLLREARLRGNRTLNGLGMLLHQGRPAWKSWFGIEPGGPPRVRAIIVSILARCASSLARILTISNASGQFIANARNPPWGAALSYR
jgi:hypothetical protein